jgi:hypothetical protein
VDAKEIPVSERYLHLSGTIPVANFALLTVNWDVWVGRDRLFKAVMYLRSKFRSRPSWSNKSDFRDELPVPVFHNFKKNTETS